MSEVKSAYRDLFSSNADIIKEFEAPANALDGAEILFAGYSYEGYSGDAFVLFRKGGKLFEVNGGHCSCYGLEGQWSAEETTVEALKKHTYGLRKQATDELFPLPAASYRINGKPRKNAAGLTEG